MIRLLADQNFDHDLIRGVLRRRSELDVISVRDIGLSEANDSAVLKWAAEQGRVLLTHDVNTMTRFAAE